MCSPRIPRQSPASRRTSALSHGVAVPLRAFEVPSAKNAAHCYGVNKVRISRTLAVRASFRHHFEPPHRPGFSKGTGLKSSCDGSTLLGHTNAHFWRQIIGFVSEGLTGKVLADRNKAIEDPTYTPASDPEEPESSNCASSESSDSPADRPSARVLR